MSVTASAPAAERRSKRRLLIVVAVLAAIALWAGTRLWWRSAHLIETNNAYVSGHIHPLSSRVAGIVDRVMIEDNQFVRKGDPLIELDPTDQLLRIEQLQAQIRTAEKQLSENDAQQAQARAQHATATAQVSQSEAQLMRAKREAERMNQLYGNDRRLVSKAQVDTANTEYASATADLRARRDGGVRTAEAQIAATQSARGVIESRIEDLKVQLKDLRQQLAYTRTVAPVSGRIGGRSVEVGVRLQAGQQFAAIVQKDIWIIANFKETQLAEMRPGLVAKIHIDAIPGHVLNGRVDSLAPATGAQFALLPPDNATGNFTKIVQRVPIKIVLRPEDIAHYADRLVPGMSAVVEIESGE